MDEDKKYRVKKFGEVFTPPHIVKDMCDMVKDYTYDIDKTFLEPSCGDGAFLVELLERKLSIANKDNKNEVYRAVSSIYGVDIQNDNVIKAKKRMIDICRNADVNEDTLNGCKKIIDVNILHGNMLPDKDGYSTQYLNGDMDSEYILMFYKWKFWDETYTATPTTIGKEDNSLGKSEISGSIESLHKRKIPYIDASKEMDEFAI